MKTELSHFCSALHDALAPLLESLGAASEQLLRREDPNLHPLAERISGVQQDLAGLLRKVEEQQAYVLIFGPIKSGKSTLMNAICGSYVSEVTALPAYPCLVHVRHGEQTGFCLEQYDGETREFAGADEIQSIMDQGYRDLADCVRECEDRGVAFDPAVHLPSAIRRVAVQLPIENLRESGTVLVDTPGLYTKMKFGYDLMTQEFRASAASAVFVVKADNLFLEQVFTDFNELLELFSRIFVVINIDATKRDLRPDGALVQSLESRDPNAIVEAFESLTMSASLRHAVESGRLRIYPIDLLHAAARRLGGRHDGDEEDVDRFDQFLADLTAYLNSDDHWLEFMADALRRGETLCEDLQGEAQGPAFEAVRTQHRGIAERLAGIARQRYALERVCQIDWATCLAPIRLRHRQARRELADETEQRFQSEAAPALKAWFDSDDSLHGLRDQRWGAVLRRAVGDLRDQIQRQLAAQGALPAGGLALPGGAQKDLDLLQLDLAAGTRDCLASLPPLEVPDASIQVDTDRIPVRRSLWDILFFRGARAVRRRLLGNSAELNRPIASRLKDQRLGPEARDILLQSAHGEGRRILGSLTEAGERQDQQFTAVLVDQLQVQLGELDRRLAQELAAGQAAESSIGTLEAELDRLAAGGAGVRRALKELGQLQRPPDPGSAVDGRIDLAQQTGSTA